MVNTDHYEYVKFLMPVDRRGPSGLIVSDQFVFLKSFSLAVNLMQTIHRK